jgi:hypothetical protein
MQFCEIGSESQLAARNCLRGFAISPSRAAKFLRSLVTRRPGWCEISVRYLPARRSFPAATRESSVQPWQVEQVFECIGDLLPEGILGVAGAGAHFCFIVFGDVHARALVLQ